jgi:hypothetical protein
LPERHMRPARIREISSASNALLKVFRRALAEGTTRQGWLAVEGPFLLEEALKAAPRAKVHSVLASCSGAEKFAQLRREEDSHRHRLIELCRSRFGEHIPLIRRQDVRGFVRRDPLQSVRPWDIQRVRRQVALMELETQRFYTRAAESTTDAEMRQLLGDLAGLLRAAGHPPSRDGDAELGHDLLRLVLMDLQAALLVGRGIFCPRSQRERR